MKVTLAAFYDAGIVYVLAGENHFSYDLHAIYCESIELIFEFDTPCLVVKSLSIKQPLKIYFGGRYFIQGE